jgi:hypothetical protein
MEKVIYASAARTATPTAVEFSTYRARGLRIVFDVTAVTATPLLTLTIDGKDNLSGKYFNLLTSAVIGTAVTTVFAIAPGITVAANLSAAAHLPDTCRLTVSHGDADSATYTVSAHILK